MGSENLFSSRAYKVIALASHEISGRPCLNIEHTGVPSD